MKNFNDKYTVRDFIDKSKWANVYTATNNENEENVILNVLINVDGNEEGLERFQEEVNILKEIDNPNLISINDMSTYINKDKVHYYIESEKFQGISLDELMNINKLNEKQCLQIIREVINGVKGFNNKNMNFDNLNLDNIIINGEGIVKIDTLSFINNHKGHINCKAHNSKKFDSYKDVYTIGCILCEMITGSKVFNKEECKYLDEDIVEILEKSTNKKHISKFKYKNLNELLNDVSIYLDEEPIYENKVDVINLEKITRLKSNPKIRKYILIACSSIVLVCTVVFGIQYLINRNNENMQATIKSEDYSKKKKESEEDIIQESKKKEENYSNLQNSQQVNKEQYINNSKDNEVEYNNEKNNLNHKDDSENGQSDKDNSINQNEQSDNQHNQNTQPGQDNDKVEEDKNDTSDKENEENKDEQGDNSDKNQEDEGDNNSSNDDKENQDKNDQEPNNENQQDEENSNKENLDENTNKDDKENNDSSNKNNKDSNDNKIKIENIENE